MIGQTMRLSTRKRQALRILKNSSSYLDLIEWENEAWRIWSRLMPSQELGRTIVAVAHNQANVILFAVLQIHFAPLWL